MRLQVFHINLVFFVMLLAGCQTVSVKQDTSNDIQTNTANDIQTNTAPACSSATGVESQTNLDTTAGCPSKIIKVDAAKDFSIRKSLSAAIYFLSKGKVKDAETILNHVLILDADNKNAMDLLSQIQMDPVEYFGQDYVIYKVKRGDTMTSLSQRFLKNHLKFYLFSRYSGIDNPSSLVMGQKVKVPLKFKRNFEKARRLDSLLSTSKTLLNEGKYEKTIMLLESEDAYKNHKTLKLRLKQAYMAEADTQEQKGAYENALHYYRRVTELSDKPELYQSKIMQLENNLKSDDLLRLARLHLKSGQYDVALKNIDESLVLNPDLTEAEVLKESISALIDGGQIDLALDY